MKRVSIFDVHSETIKEASEIDELHGSLKNSTDDEDKLMHSVLEHDKEEFDDGKVIVESINQGISCFTPDMVFRNITKNFQMAKKLYGETLIRRLSGYDPNYVKKNINIPEFQRELKNNVAANIDRLKKKGLLDQEGNVTDEAVKLSSLVLYMEELDRLVLRGYGDKKDKKNDVYGEKDNVRNFRKDPYRDISVRKSIKTAIRRGHASVLPEDLKAFDRKKKGKINIVYAVDASGSMKGKKLGSAKRAGVALAFKAIQEKNSVGLVVFGSEIKTRVEPCLDFKVLLEELCRIQASSETDIAMTIKESVSMFPKGHVTKHLILLSDALPTTGEEPISETLEAASFARDNGITISVIGFDLEKDGLKVARRVAEVGNGRLYKVKDLDNLDVMVLEEYQEIV